MLSVPLPEIEIRSATLPPPPRPHSSLATSPFPDSNVLPSKNCYLLCIQKRSLVLSTVLESSKRKKRSFFHADTHLWLHNSIDRFHQSWFIYKLYRFWIQSTEIRKKTRPYFIFKKRLKRKFLIQMTEFHRRKGRRFHRHQLKFTPWKNPCPCFRSTF